VTPETEALSMLPHLSRRVHDRLRARPPPTDVDAWTEAVVREVARTEGGFEVTVAPTPAEAGAASVVVTVTAAIFDLFTGRLNRDIDGPEDVVGATVWFK
jgi:hypothetical protein